MDTYTCGEPDIIYEMDRTSEEPEEEECQS